MGSKPKNRNKKRANVQLRAKKHAAQTAQNDNKFGADFDLALRRVQFAKSGKETELFLNALAIEAIPPLDELKTLKILDISQTNISDLSPISNLRKLEELDLSHTPISDLTPIAGLRHLRKLNLAQTKVTDLKILGSLSSLKSLNLAGAAISTLARLPPSLNELDLSASKISDIRKVSHCDNITFLDISRTKITDLHSLKKLKKLRTLIAANSSIADIEPLRQLQRLKELDIRNTKVRDLSPLARATSLITTSAQENVGVEYRGCQIDDKLLLKLALKDNPDRTRETISYLRHKQNLPPLSAKAPKPDTNTATDERKLSPRLPRQGAGPHFEITNDAIIDFAPSKALDSHGNNIGRLRALHPLLIEAARNMRQELSTNEQPRLFEMTNHYLQLINQDLKAISFDQLFAAGLRLENAAAAAKREIASRVLPELEDPAREALDSLIQIHGLFVMSSAVGIELVSVSERYQRQPEEDAAFRSAAMNLAKAIQARSDIMARGPARFLVEVAEEIDSGPRAERATVVGVGTFKNVCVVLVGGALVGLIPIVGGAVAGIPGGILGGAIALLVGDTLRKSEPFTDVVEVGKKKFNQAAKISSGDVRALRSYGLDRYCEFILEHESILRVLAGDRPQFSWIQQHIDWLKTHQLPKADEKIDFMKATQTEHWISGAIDSGSPPERKDK